MDIDILFRQDIAIDTQQPETWPAILLVNRLDLTKMAAKKSIDDITGVDLGGGTYFGERMKNFHEADVCFFIDLGGEIKTLKDRFGGTKLIIHNENYGNIHYSCKNN